MRKKLATVTAHRELTVNSRRAHGDQNGYSQPWLPWPGPWLSCDLASHDWAVIAVIELWSCCDRHRENFGAFTGPKGDFGLILWILNMIMHMSFTGPTQFLPVNVRGPVSFAVFAVTELWPSCDWAVTELWPSLAVTSHRGHR